MIRALKIFLNENAIGVGVSGTIASFSASAAGYFIQQASVLLGFIAALFGAGTAIFTFLIVRQKYARERRARIDRRRDYRIARER